MDASTKPYMVELEEKLAKDRDNAYRKEIIMYLSSELHKVNQKLGTLLPPDEYKKESKLQEALISAIRVMYYVIV